MEAVEAAGIKTQKTFVMANIKLQPAIDYHHNQWCRDNGYETIGYKPGPGRPKKKDHKPTSTDSQASKPSAKGGPAPLILKFTSSKILEPGNKRTSSGSRDEATRIKVFFLCFI